MTGFIIAFLSGAAVGYYGGHRAEVKTTMVGIAIGIGAYIVLSIIFIGVLQ